MFRIREVVFRLIDFKIINKNSYNRLKLKRV
jgi:hypothetical protein